MPVEVVPVKPLGRTSTLGTCDCEPSAGETPFFGRLDRDERVTGDPFGDPYTIHGKEGRFVGWYRVVRGIRAVADAPGLLELLVEQKQADGLTDCHIMLASASGGGRVDRPFPTEDYCRSLLGDPATLGTALAPGAWPR